MPNIVSLANSEIAVDLSPVGAELMSLRDAQSREWLWQGSPQSWPRRAPMLFPVIGRCAGGGVRHKGRFYKLTIHGYAPDKAFSVLSSGGEECTFRCDPDEETRAVYPFDLRLDVTFQLDGPRLRRPRPSPILATRKPRRPWAFTPDSSGRSRAFPTVSRRTTSSSSSGRRPRRSAGSGAGC